MSALAPTASKQEIEGEIVFLTVLITTLDQDADDFEEKKNEYDAALADLEGRLEALDTSGHPSRPETPISRANGSPTPSFLGSGRSYELPSREAKAQRANTLAPPSPLNHKSSWNWPPVQAEQPRNRGSGTSTPSSNASNVNKRHGDSLQPNGTHKKSKHKSEATGASSVSTPASVDSIDRDEELVEKQYGTKILASNREYLLEKRKEQEAASLARIKAEWEDREMARMLAAQPANPGFSASSSTSQSYFHPNGQLQRPQATSRKPSIPPPQSHTSQNHIKAESDYRALTGRFPTPSTRPPVAQQKPFASHQNFTPRTQQTLSSTLPTYNLVDSDDDDDDSDLQVISPSQFAQNVVASNRPAKSGRSSHLSSMNGNSLPSQRFQTGAPYSGSHYAASSHAVPNYATSGGLPNQMFGGTSVYDGYRPTDFSSTLAGIQQGGAAIWNGLSSAAGFFAGGNSIDLRGDDDGSELPGPSAYPFGYRPTFEESLHARGLDYMLADPSKTREELETLLENIRPDEEIPPEMRIGSPEQLSVGLMEHQKLGLAWLKAQEEGTNKGGILADDMGLGKTIQALALIATRPSEDLGCKTTLIVAPVSLMRQWRMEIEEKMLPRHKLSVYIMHGKQKKATFAKLSTYDVVITTFGTVSAELKRKEKFLARLETDANASRRRDEEVVLLGDRSKWYRIIVDEAQMIKNKSTKAALGCLHLNAEYRFCMTGTPMMNNVGELFSLIRFLRIPPYNNLNRFNREIKKAVESRSEREKQKGMLLLQGLLKAILLRRTKKSLVDGKPILQLPERTTEIVHAVFDEEQEKFYKAIEGEAIIQVSKYLAAGKIGRNYSYILVRLLRLRQACCHPHLIKDFAQDGPGDVSKDEMRELVKKLSNEVISRIKETQGQFECPICYDAVGNPTIFFPCGHDCCSECFARITDPSLAMAQGNENVDAKCPECRNRLDVKKVFDYNAFKEIHMPEEVQETDTQPAFGNEDSETESESDDESTDDDDADSQGDLRDFVVSDDESIDEETNDDDRPVKFEDDEVEESASNDEPPRKQPSSKAKTNKNPSRKSKKAKGKEKKRDKTKKLAELRREGLRNASAKKRYLRRLRKDWVSSCKIDKTMEILRRIRENSPNEKIIIFSQFTSFLDLLEVPVDEDGWDYRRYDGSMSAKMRDAAVEDFKRDRRVRVMLVSLKAGNAGLNLNAASQVIILDPFWNPFIEEQAIDRAHRIGQTRPVQVHRVLVQETVEDRIIALQEKKREMINEALDEKAGQSVSRLGRQELRYLFGISGHL